MNGAVARVDLERRAEPKQKRAQERIEQIIAATQDLLDHMPPEDITTSAVAREADIPVGSVYRYFPNIHAIYSAIFDRFHEQTAAIISENEPGGDWRSSLADEVAAMAQLLEERPSWRAVVLLTFSTPQLASVREKWNAQFAQTLAKRWGGDTFSSSDPLLVARMVVEIFGAAQMQILRHWDDAEKRQSIARERFVAIERYLGAYLG